MHVYVDDSGDAGFKFDAGSTTYLVFASCVFSSETDVEAAADAIHRCRRKLGRSDRWEFKYSKTSRDMQEEFFMATRSLSYVVRAIIAEKPKIYSDPLLSRPGYLQNHLIMQMMSNTLGTIRDAKLVIDGRDSRAFRLQSGGYFLREVNRRAPGTLRKVSHGDSVRNPLIQLADMTAGAIRRHYEHPERANNKHFAMIKARTHYPEGSMWEFTAYKNGDPPPS